MSSKEKTIVGILVVVIILALIGIGVLAARLLGVEKTVAVTVAPTTETTPVPATMTPVATPMLGVPPATPPGGQPPAETPPPPPPPPAGTPPSGQSPGGSPPVVVVQATSAGPGLPAILTDQPLQPGHRYRLVITAADGGAVAIQGSWSQAATSASGEAAPPQIEFFEGMTPYTIEVIPPVADPAQWGLSISVAPKDPLDSLVILVITLYAE